MQVTLDITGGTKVMTAGMVLAGFANQALMEYTQTARDEKGDIKNPSYAWYIWSNGKFSQETK